MRQRIIQCNPIESTPLFCCKKKTTKRREKILKMLETTIRFDEPAKGFWLNQPY